MKNYSQKKSGFTLLETIVYIALFNLIFIAIMNATLTFYNSNRYTLEQMDQLDSARKGVAAMVGGIREATYSETGTYPIEAASDNSITYYADYDNDGVVERVRYFLTGTNFQRGVVEPTGSPLAYTGAESVVTLAQYIRNTAQAVNIFQYYDSSGTLMTSQYTLINIRYVKVSLIVNVNPATLPNEFTLRSSAAIRNLKSNL